MNNYLDRIPEYMSIVECCAYFGIPKHWLRRCIKDEKVLFVRTGNAYRVNVTSLRRLLEDSNHTEE